jgi:F0F1-type ATP synthase assembly protein I
MSDRPPDPKDMGRYLALAQVGMEMVVPVAFGAYLDSRLGWGPWGVVGGAVLGLVGGFVHLLVMLKRFEPKDSPPRQDSQ